MEESFFESPLIPRKDATLREQKDLLAKEAETHEENVRMQLQIATLVGVLHLFDSRRRRSISTIR